MFPYNFITIDGNTGAGKTTLTQMLARDFGGELILEEFADNPFLPLFYATPERYAFSTELYFLIDRYEQLKETLAERDLYGKLHFADYIFQKSLLYAKANLHGEEYNLFKRIFNTLLNDLPEPELLIYIHSKADRLVKNIQKRGRDFEQVVRKTYLQTVENIYFEHFEQNKHLRILIITADDIDFVVNPKDYQRICDAITKEFDPGIHHISL